MASVNTNEDVEKAAKKAAVALYGTDIKDFKVRVVFPFPSEHKRDSWDVQVTFLSNGVQYTVDLMINEKNGQITNARLIDKMTPL
ncbi:MAG TPA: hypothetical protein VK553_08975 [Candidatus Nitrosopolaris rasttigaisensis]|jgi:hypothetical protein|nr:hypothetical protein [Candidatus Nitrosopolaris rasttigaisensis]